MDRKIILDKLRSIFIDIFTDEKIVLEEGTNANDIEAWDSLAHITILESVQDEFDVIFTLDEIVGMENVGDIINAIIGKLY